MGYRQYGSVVFFNGEYQEGLDSTNADEGSSDEGPPQGIFSSWKLFFNFVAVGLRAGMEGFHPVVALQPALHFIFSIFQG